MPIDETPTRVVIHDLQSEIESIEADEAANRPIFFRNIDKKVSAIPQHLLQSKDLITTPNNQLILYKDPRSIFVPEEEDAVRRSIIEARVRLREKQAKDWEQNTTTLAEESGKSADAAHGNMQDDDYDDPDAMDIG